MLRNSTRSNRVMCHEGHYPGMIHSTVGITGCIIWPQVGKFSTAMCGANTYNDHTLQIPGGTPSEIDVTGFLLMGACFGDSSYVAPLMQHMETHDVCRGRG